MVESFAKLTNSSMTGRKVYPFADYFFVQWEEMKKVYPKSDTETMEELIAENEEIKTENDRLKHENAVLRAAISRKSEEDMEYD